MECLIFVLNLRPNKTTQLTIICKLQRKEHGEGGEGVSEMKLSACSSILQNFVCLGSGELRTTHHLTDSCS